MKIYTKKGDDGSTSLLGGTRVPKSHLRIDAYGTVDELNAFIGMIRDQVKDEAIQEVIQQIQERLFTIGSTLAADPGKSNIKKPDLADSDIALLETEMDKMDELLPPLQHFILPGGHPAVSACHVARCICRRAERQVVALNDREKVDEIVLVYLNRLSDYLFVLARRLGQLEGADEIPWKPRN